MKQDNTNILDDLVRKALKSGADAADAVFLKSTSVSVSRRLGNPEALERSESCDMGLRVFVGKRQAVVSTTDLAPDTLQKMADQSVSMARAVPEDPWCGLADPADLSKTFPDLDLYDAQEPSAQTLIELADRCEDAARAVKGITNSEGAQAGFGQTETILVTSGGFAGRYLSSGCSLSVSVIAGKDDGMERDYEYDAQTFFADLKAPEDIGKSAGERTVRRLKPQKAKTARVPVVYDPRVSGGILGSLASAINGVAIARGTSLLKDKMGAQILPAHISIVDDPHIRRGHRSRPFDGEGLATKKMLLVENGVLKSWILDLSSARQLGLKSTGHAVRGTSGPPGPKASNLYMQPGEKTPQELIAEIEDGFYVTEMMGSSINMLTGDYSRGAAGFWIKNGRIDFPVSEITVAGNLLDMWKNLMPANDLNLKYGIDAPTLRIDGMTIAGA